MIEDLVLQRGMQEALKGKFVFSLAAGITLAQLTSWMPHSRTLFFLSLDLNVASMS